MTLSRAKPLVPQPDCACRLASGVPAHANRGPLLPLAGGTHTLDSRVGGNLKPWAASGVPARTGRIGAADFAIGAKAHAYPLAVER